MLVSKLEQLEGFMNVASFKFRPPFMTQVNHVNFETLQSVISKVGGFFTTLYGLTFFIVYPFLYISMMNHITRTIQKQENESQMAFFDVQKIIKERVSFVGLYNLHEWNEERQSESGQDEPMVEDSSPDKRSNLENDKESELKNSVEQLQERVNVQEVEILFQRQKNREFEAILKTQELKNLKFERRIEEL